MNTFGPSAISRLRLRRSRRPYEDEPTGAPDCRFSGEFSSWVRRNAARVLDGLFQTKDPALYAVMGERRKTDGEPGRNRTFNLLIKSQLLCQLSYGPEGGRTMFSLANEIHLGQRKELQCPTASDIADWPRPKLSAEEQRVSYSGPACTESDNLPHQPPLRVAASYDDRGHIES